MKKYLCLIGVLGILLCNTANSYAQKVAVKTNLLYDATTTMNLGLEIGLGKKWSLDLSGNYNPWKFDDETRLATGAYSRNFATGFVRNSTVIFWVCTDITPNTMWAECHF